MATDRSICGHISFIRLKFANYTIPGMIRVPKNINLADSGTKNESNFCQSLQQLFPTFRIPFNFNEASQKSSDKLTGWH